MKREHLFLSILTGAILIVVALIPEMRSPIIDFFREGNVEGARFSEFRLPKGFTVSTFAENVPDVRNLTEDSRGTLIATLSGEGKIIALPDEDHDYEADATIIVTNGLINPKGTVIRCNEEGEECMLYVAETDAVRSFLYYPETYSIRDPKNLASLPNGAGSARIRRGLVLHPDGKRLLISIGSSCDSCFEEDSRYGAVLALDLETNDLATFATGLRNTLFMKAHPETGEIWGSDLGRGSLGDDLPPDEVNIIAEGNDYGWPLCYGDNIHDTLFDPDSKNPCKEPLMTPARLSLPAHVTPNGLGFIPEEGWPEEYWHDLLIAYRGSVYQNVLSGYEVVRVPLDKNGRRTGPIRHFMEGFLTEAGTVIGRPSAILVQPNGVVYVSDDKAGIIYRISYEGEE
ncbi:MAG: PQQ-dependent sugar dehydrogenase [Candidatus Pacebacteria bacterium]|nr:PQQ-dependent sugar dehydrogenase [Candidatus Paceibacterota bacterium]